MLHFQAFVVMFQLGFNCFVVDRTCTCNGTGTGGSPAMAMMAKGSEVVRERPSMYSTYGT